MKVLKELMLKFMLVHQKLLLVTLVGLSAVSCARVAVDTETINKLVADMNARQAQGCVKASAVYGTFASFLVIEATGGVKIEQCLEFDKR